MLCGALLMGYLLTVIGCHSNMDQANEEEVVPDLSARETAEMNGAELAQIYCSSCHAFPDPDRLSKQIWAEKVLPHMAHRVGIKDSLVNPLKEFSNHERQLIEIAGIYPEQPLVDSTTWHKIVQYYSQQAPDTLLPATNKPAVERSLPEFRLDPVSPNMTSGPLTTAIHLDTLRQQLLIASASNNTAAYQYRDSSSTIFQTNSPIVDVYQDDQKGAYYLQIGIMFPTQQRTGQLVYQDSLGKKTVCIDYIHRPVHASFADLNQDGLEDVVISSYGHFTGRLSWWENKGKFQYQEHMILNQPGALKTIILDFDQDGRPDIMSLFGQGREGVYVHLNRGHRGFATKQILQFEPVNGSAYFELADFEGDGDLDILYANGDNADYSFSLKPYHGVHIFTNDGQDQFEEAYFYPMYGAFNAKARDFDQDGDLDIAAIAFFPDYSAEEPESFVFLENHASENGRFPSFSPKSFPDAARGHWLILETGDLNQDGRTDIFLGAFAFSTTPVPTAYKKRWRDENIHALILWNETDAD